MKRSASSRSRGGSAYSARSRARSARKSATPSRSGARAMGKTLAAIAGREAFTAALRLSAGAMSTPTRKNGRRPSLVPVTRGRPLLPQRPDRHRRRLRGLPPAAARVPPRPALRRRGRGGRRRRGGRPAGHARLRPGRHGLPHAGHERPDRHRRDPAAPSRAGDRRLHRLRRLGGRVLRRGRAGLLRQVGLPRAAGPSLPTAGTRSHAGVASRPMDDLELLDRYWRAANYLSVGQIYLLDNPLLRAPLTLEHVKPRLLGHWGTTPGLNL